ncbi:MAG TPA: glycosyltransferase family 39 protein [Bacteroidota bacterium]|nr:glycosyltransferase family 39 protein [Bacteroidota bacterium]
MTSHLVEPALSSSHPRLSLSRLAVFLAFIAGAAALRGYHLSWQSLWNDEMFSLEVARLPFGEIQRTLVEHYHHPPLYFYLLHAVVKMFGENEWSLRLISAIAGSLSVGCVFLIGAEWFGAIPGGLAALVCMVAPFHIAYSQEARPYALAGLLCLVCCYCLWKAIRSERTAWLISYGISGLALLYTHHWGMFFILAQIGYVLILSGASNTFKKMFAILCGVSALCYLPEAIALMHQVPVKNSPDWFWAESASPRELLQIAQAFSGTYFKFASSIFTVRPLLRFCGTALIFLLSVAAFWRIAEKHYVSAGGYILVCVFGTLLVPFLISFARPEIFLWYRYPVIVFPLFCLAAAAMVRYMEQEWAGAVLVLLLLAASLPGTFRYYTWSKSNVKAVVAYVDEWTEGEMTMVVRPNYFAPLFNYYYRGKAQQFDETYLDQSLGPVIDTASAFVFISLDAPDEIRDYIDRHFLKLEERIFPGEAHMGIVVGIYRRSENMPRRGEDLMTAEIWRKY